MLVLGGGVIGRSIAWRLARQEKYPVTLIENAKQYPLASKAAAGMLAPGAEAYLGNKDLYKIGVESLASFPSYLRELQVDSGRKVDLLSEGTLLVAEDTDGLCWLKQRQSQLRQMGQKCLCLTAKQVRDREPLLSARILAALHLPDERSVCVQRLLHAYDRALQRFGVVRFTGSVTEVCQRYKEWVVRLGNGQELSASRLLLAPGAWLNKLRFPENIVVPQVIANQGSLVQLQMESSICLRHMVRSRYVYLCPKLNGVCRVGASSSYEGYSIRPLAGELRDCLKRTWELVPGLDHAVFHSVLHGLRPDRNVSLPTVSKATQEGLFWATGWGRAGVLLSPWAAYKIEQLLQEDSNEYYSTSERVCP